MNYFKMSSMRSAPPVGTIRVRRPITSIGTIVDVDGNKWNVRGITSGGVSACPLQNLHPYYTETSGNNYGNGTSGSDIISQKWDAYLVEVVQ